MMISLLVHLAIVVGIKTTGIKENPGQSITIELVKSADNSDELNPAESPLERDDSNEVAEPAQPPTRQQEEPIQHDTDDQQETTQDTVIAAESAITKNNVVESMPVNPSLATEADPDKIYSPITDTPYQINIHYINVAVHIDDQGKATLVEWLDPVDEFDAEVLESLRKALMNTEYPSIGKPYKDIRQVVV